MCSGGRAFGVGLYKKAKLTSQPRCFSPEFLEALAHVLGKARLEVLHLAERLADLVAEVGELRLQVAEPLVEGVEEVVVVGHARELLLQEADAAPELDKLRLQDA